MQALLDLFVLGLSIVASIHVVTWMFDQTDLI